MNKASGQSSSMSRAKSKIIGNVRSVKNSPPGPPFSPSVCRMPYFFGTSKSDFHNWLRSMAVASTTNSAPSSAARRSTVCSIFKPAPDLSFINRPRCALRSRRPASLPTSVNVLPASSVDANTSLNMLRPKDMLPAPINTILALLVIGNSLPAPASSPSVTLFRKPLQSDKGWIGVNDNTGRDRFEIVSETSFGHEPLPKRRARREFGNLRHDPAGDINASPRAEGEREISSDSPQNRTEHFDGGTTDRTAAFDGSFGYFNGAPLGNTHTIDFSNRVIEIF